MNSAAPPPRTALVAGATGLVGRALLPLLEASDAYAGVHVLVRRPVTGIEANPKVAFHTVDFAHLPQPFPAADDVYIALGTTIKVAQTQEAFRHVDHDYVVNTARAARRAGARRLAVVSALGADAHSRVFYNRVKGEMQEAIVTLGYESVVIAQPSLLTGDRASLGQPIRAGEVWATRLLSPLMGWVPKGIRPIPASVVADALLDATLAGAPGVHHLSSAQMLAHHR
ncbi:MAG TPA: NAD(P)H-binding protein [Burkholderiaceae bacterium]|nr:NAD(P)H-binding protein [Burkholderiaceae bacterium]